MQLKTSSSAVGAKLVFARGLYVSNLPDNVSYDFSNLLLALWVGRHQVCPYGLLTTLRLIDNYLKLTDSLITDNCHLSAVAGTPVGRHPVNFLPVN